MHTIKKILPMFKMQFYVCSVVLVLVSGTVSTHFCPKDFEWEISPFLGAHFPVLYFRLSRKKRFCLATEIDEFLK